MSTSKLAHSGSDSWSMMPSAMHEGLTEMATAATAAAGPTPCDVGDIHTQTALPMKETAAAVVQSGVLDEAPADVTCDADDTADGAASQATDDSWVELTAAELEPPSSNPLAAAAAAEEETAGKTPAEEREEDGPSLLNTEAIEQHAHDGDEFSATQLQVTEMAKQNDEATPLGCAVALPAAANEADVPATAAPVSSAAQPKIDLAEFLAGLTLTRAHDATTAASATDSALTVREAAAQALASFDAVEATDDFTSLAADDEEMEETVDLQLLPSSMPAQRKGNNSSNVGERGASRMPPPTGCTEVLRRRMVAEDWMRTLHGPSELTPQERVEVFQALFGDTGNDPISAERFKEMMVPFERHCDCLGASYGFHHQGCRFYQGSGLTS
jgi:hypothetical protein